jgi:hypothetical protein
VGLSDEFELGEIGLILGLVVVIGYVLYKAGGTVGNAIGAAGSAAKQWANDNLAIGGTATIPGSGGKTTTTTMTYSDALGQVISNPSTTVPEALGGMLEGIPDTVSGQSVYTDSPGFTQSGLSLSMIVLGTGQSVQSLLDAGYSEDDINQIVFNYAAQQKGTLKL